MKSNRDSFTLSPWQQNANQFNKANNPSQSDSYDVIIIGAGITGLTTALLLQQQGKKCVILEGHNVGYGTTGGTTAHINTFFDSSYPQIEKNFNVEAVKIVADSGKKALQMITSLVDTYQINCDLETKTGYLFSEDEEQTEKLNEILNASQRAGLTVEESTKNEVPIDFSKAIAFDNQAQFHPLKYVLGLAQEFCRLGGVIVEDTFINEIKTEDNIHIAFCDEKQFKGSNLVWATHVPPGVNQFSFRCAPYRSYVLGIRLENDSQYPNGLANDMQEPYHYFRTHVIDNIKLLILGGSDHKTGHGNPEDSFKELEDYARKYFDIESIPYKWSSQYYVPVDGLPYIGLMNSMEENIYVATGFYGNGMTWGTISGMIISDAILKIDNPYADLFKPSRSKPIAGFTDFVKENADVVYHFITDRFTSQEIDSLSELNPGQGKIVSYKGEKLAVYKDELGQITALHPTCTHAGCTVLFNQSEKSWDCPCHGGRFDINGKVLSGPPQKNLPPVKLDTITS